MTRRLFLLALSAVLLAPVPGLAALPPAEASSQVVISPGARAGRFALGDPLPAARVQQTLLKREGIAFQAGANGIARITVSSARYAVERTGLRVGAPLADVLRFYGTGEKELREKVVFLVYPAQGIEFGIEPGTDRVRSVAVFAPVRLKAPVEQYRKLYQYREQFKAR